MRKYQWFVVFVGILLWVASSMPGMAVFAADSVLDTIQRARQSGEGDSTVDSPSPQLSSSSADAVATSLDTASAQKAYQDAYNHYLGAMSQEKSAEEIRAAYEAYKKAYNDVLWALRNPATVPVKEPETGTTVETGCGTNTETSDNTGTVVDTGLGTDTGADTGSGTGTGADTGSGTGTGADTGSGTGTGTGTGTGINSTGLKYGVQAMDGSAKWTQAQKNEANRILETLPECFRSCTTQVIRETDRARPGALGWSDMKGSVWLADCSCTGRSFQGPFIHEMTHGFQGTHPDILKAWKSQFWATGRPDPTSVSSYGNSVDYEDMAESVREYWQAGREMKSTHPDRYEFIRKYVMNGVEFADHYDN
ncbi:MAG: hypothetical protein WA705_25400 [Candidatus Ozemobacteraceae bacterium]